VIEKTVLVAADRELPDFTSKAVMGEDPFAAVVPVVRRALGRGQVGCRALGPFFTGKPGALCRPCIRLRSATGSVGTRIWPSSANASGKLPANRWKGCWP
jgi:hypothetical protein